MHYIIEGEPGKLFGALAGVQAELPPVPKSRRAEVPGKDGRAGYSYQYADLADVLRVALPVLAKHGLCILQPSGVEQHFGDIRSQDQCCVRVETLLAHGESNCRICVSIELWVQGASPQAVGSAITYARRYSLTSLLGIAAEDDDDGHGAALRNERAAQREQPRRDSSEPSRREQRREPPAQRRDPPEQPREPPEQRRKPSKQEEELARAKRVAAARKWLVEHGKYSDGMLDADMVALYQIEWSAHERTKLAAEGVDTTGMSNEELAKLVRERKAAAKANAEPPLAASKTTSDPAPAAAKASAEPTAEVKG